MADKLTCYIEEVKQKRSGISEKGKAWTLYEILTLNPQGKPGITLITFEGGWVNLIGKMVETTYETKTRGQYTDFHAGELKDARVVNGQSATQLPPASNAIREPSVTQSGFTAEDRAMLSEVVTLLRQIHGHFR